jgi:hypothetical protein
LSFQRRLISIRRPLLRLSGITSIRWPSLCLSGCISLLS